MATIGAQGGVGNSHHVKQQTETNKMQAETNKIQAETNKKQKESNRDFDACITDNTTDVATLRANQARMQRQLTEHMASTNRALGKVSRTANTALMNSAAAARNAGLDANTEDKYTEYHDPNADVDKEKVRRPDNYNHPPPPVKDIQPMDTMEEGDEDESVVVGDVVEEVVVDRVVVVVDSSVVLTVEVGSVDSVVGSLVLYVVVLAVVIDGSVVGTGGASLLVSAEQSSPHLQSLSSGTIFEAISEQT